MASSSPADRVDHPLTLLPTRGGLGAAALPRPLTTLVGREREVALALALLRRPDVRLLTLTGAGGIGKTRLSLEVARVAADPSTSSGQAPSTSSGQAPSTSSGQAPSASSELAIPRACPEWREGDRGIGERGQVFSDGVRFVPLAAVSEVGLVPRTVVHALDIPEGGAGSARDTLVLALRDADLLLVLDNFEHVVAAAPLITDLLAACPRLTILVTSRILLRVTGEHALPVPPLSLGEEGDAGSAAVRLFAERAQAVNPTFTLTDETAPLVTEVCRHLDGLPLAIELAAARASHLALPALRERLERRLPLLTGGPRDAPPRLQTMRDAIAWSHDLLTPTEQALLRRLAAFAGGFSLEAAEAVCQGAGTATPAPSVLDGIAALVESSLVLLEGDADEPPRYRMLETIREFAAERLAASGDEQWTHLAHAGFFLAFAEQRAVAPFLPDDGRRLAELAAEGANLHAALAWLAAHGEAADFARLVAALGWYWGARGHFHDGHAWCERALAHAGLAPAAVRARIAIAFGLTLLSQGDHRRAGHWVQESLALAQSVGDALGATQALVGLGVTATAEGEYDRATAHFEEALALARAVDDPRLATALESAALANLGVAARGQGRLAAAAAAHEAALVRQREVGHARGAAASLLDLGEVAREQGDLARAFASLREGLLLAWEHGETRLVVEALEGFACMAVHAEQAVAAARLFAATEPLRELTGFTQRFPLDRARYERAVAAARTSLGESAFAAAWAAGRALPLARAVAEALDFAAAPAMPPPGLLSPREIEVLRLLVAGQPDRAIAEALFVSVRTVEGHVARIFAKLGVRTRTAAVRAAIAAGLAAPPAADTSRRD